MIKAFEAFVKNIYDGLSFIYAPSQKIMFFKYCKHLFKTRLIMNAVFNSKLPCKQELLRVNFPRELELMEMLKHFIEINK